jgi:tRNA modification GTPase
LAKDICTAISGRIPPPRHATLCRLVGEEGVFLDEGIVLYFPAPGSYTGEDIVEFQGHGSPVVLREIVRRCLLLGARLAEPGEFTQRAFLNERLDLAQAEGVADLIDASSVAAARGAARSLSGEFSARVHALVGGLSDLRINVEACIDFPEEELDAADLMAQREQLSTLRLFIGDLFREAKQGALLREGMTVVLVGRPNVGKSSLLNRLAGEDLAIVTPIPGTTRDHVRATIHLESVPIRLIDTAGLRDSGDEVERLGIARTWEAIERANAVMLVSDVIQTSDDESGILARMPTGVPVVRVTNKIDLLDLAAGQDFCNGETNIRLSAKTGQGIEALRAWLLEIAGWCPSDEGVFLARERHLVALQKASRSLEAAAKNVQAFELLAEDLRLAQRSLGTITGEVTADHLLGQIFSRFCVGK